MNQTIRWQLFKVGQQYISEEEVWKTATKMERNLWSVLANEKSKYKEHYCIQNRTPYQNEFLGFIAFTNSFQILKTWIKSTKNSK